jgi:hypothetical protein
MNGTGGFGSEGDTEESTQKLRLLAVARSCEIGWPAARGM